MSYCCRDNIVIISLSLSFYRFGRRIVLFPSLAMVMLIGFGSSFLPSYWPFLVSRFIVGFFTPGCGVQMFVLASEFVGPKYRAFAGTILWFFFGVALMLLGLKPYHIRTWKMLLIASTVPYIFVLAFYK